MKRFYYIKILGYLWMPKCKAAARRHLEAGSGPFQYDIDPENELDDLNDYISGNTGDFSSVLDFEIDRETIETTITKKGHTEQHNIEIIRPWKLEESQGDFWDCMSPPSEEGE